MILTSGLDPFSGGTPSRMRGADRVGFELLSVVPIYEPTTAGFDVLARYRDGEMPHDCDEITVALDGGLDDGKAVVRVVKCHSVDAADGGFGATIRAGIIQYVLEDSTRVGW